MADYQELIKKDKFELKIMLLGEAKVGKTSIIDRFFDQKFSEEYIETKASTYKEKTIYRHNQEIEVNIWDSAGTEKFRYLLKVFLKGTQGLIFVYDITNRKSFEELENWMKFVYDIISRDSTKSIIVGNKSDLYEESQVSEDEARDLAKRFGVRLYLSSAKVDNGIKNIFETLINEIADDEIKIRGIDLEKDNRELNEKKKKGCCYTKTKSKVVKVSRCERWLTCLGCRDCLRYCVFCCACFKECFCGNNKCGKEAWEGCGLCISCLGCKCSYCCNLDQIDKENKCCHCCYCPKTKVVYYGDDTAAYRNFFRP